MVTKNPTIVVVAYNRNSALSRLLKSLSKSYYPSNVRLIISIDHGGDKEVIKTAMEYNWEYGEKILIKREQKMGLRQHVLACGDLTHDYESIILLEDDIFVSPYFYLYSIDAINYYKNDKNISGISLYKHSINYGNDLPFNPLEDGSDVFFLQFASSWGQVWTKEHWSEFEKWYRNNKNIDNIERVPKYIKRWPESSWLKYFITYMVVNNKYFVYPHTSLSTNYSDAGGEHVKLQDNRLQIPIQLIERNRIFRNLKDSLSIYDAYFELLPKIYKNLNRKLSGYEFDVDLYGNKSTDAIVNEYILTSKPSRNCLLSFGLNLKPIEANVLLNTSGTDVCFSHSKDILSVDRFSHAYKMYRFYFNLISLKKYIYYKMRDILNIILKK